MNDLVKGHIVFDHDGTLVRVSKGQYQLFPGIKDLLNELKQEGFALFIWTARPRASVLKIIKDLDIIHYFNDFYCYDDGIPKPDPEGLKQLIAGAPKKSVLHIGDSSTDVEGAQSFGIDVIAACWDEPSRENYWRKCTPLVASSIDECKKLIRGKYV